MKRISVLLIAMLLILSMLLCTACGDDPVDPTPDPGTSTTTTPAPSGTSSTTTTTTPTRPNRPTPNNPRPKDVNEVGTKEELLTLIENMMKYNWTFDSATIKLTADIYLNDVSDPEWYKQDGLTEWPLAGTKKGDYPFMGTFDGQGYSIYGLYADVEKTESGEMDIALFPYVSGANVVIRDVALRDGYFKGTNSGVIYYKEASASSNNQANVYSHNGELRVASLFGYSDAIKMTIENCYSDIILEGVTNAPNNPFSTPSVRLGGLFGYSYAAYADYTINNCSFYGSLLGTVGKYMAGTAEKDGSSVFAAGLTIGQWHDHTTMYISNCVIAPADLTGVTNPAAIISWRVGSRTDKKVPYLKNIFSTIPMFSGSSAAGALTKYITTYPDEWTGEPQQTVWGQMSMADFTNRQMLDFYAPDFSWYTEGEVTSDNCWVYDATMQCLVQKTFAPQP